MGLDYFCNQCKDSNIISNRSIYFGDVYIQPKKKCLSKDKYNNSRNENKPSDSYFSNKKENTNQNNIYNFLKTRNNYKEDDSPENSAIFSTTSSSSNEETKNQNIIISKKLNALISNERSKHLRKSYYQALINKNIIKRKETIKNNTIFIFDWDDTLFFTTHLNPSKNTNFYYESQREKKLMNTIEYYIAEILKKALDKGIVLIITNSSDGWVNACSKFYYPNLLPILEKINIISARELYQDEYPNDPVTWKIKTFNDLKQKFNFEKCLVSNIICIGDDNSEILAAKKLGEGFKNCLVKTIKFREKPNLTDLIKQIILINEQIMRVYNYPKSLTIHVDKKKNPNK